MEMHDVISKLEFMRNGYQKLIDENVDCGTIVGTDITGTWKAETPLNDVYKQHVEALDTAIKVLSAQPERKTFSIMTDIEFEKWLYVHGICHPDVCESIPCRIVPLLIDDAINELLSARPTLQPTCNELATVAKDICVHSKDSISRQAALNAFGLSEKTRKYGGDHSGYNTMMLYEIQDVLEGLPSLVPDGRYINADEMIKRLKQKGLNDAVEIAVKMAGHERVGERG